MRMNTCRTTKNGQKYCRTRKGVRFVKKTSTRGKKRK